MNFHIKHYSRLFSKGLILAGSISIVLLALSFHQAYDVYDETQSIIKDSEERIQLTTQLKRTANERAILINYLLLLDDPFERDDAYIQFNELASEHLITRAKIEKLPLSNTELKQLKRATQTSQIAAPVLSETAKKLYLEGGAKLDQPWSTEQIEAHRAALNEFSQLETMFRDHQHQLILHVEEELFDTFILTFLILIILPTTLGWTGWLFLNKAHQAQILTRELNEQLHKAAYYDPLTGLPNRKLMCQHIQGLEKNDTQYSVLFIDIDKFKPINDNLGHLIGDKVLKVISSRLQKQLDERDFLSRQGGDEFMIASTRTQKESLAELSEKLISSLESDFELDNHAIDISASIGIGIQQPGESMISVVHRADDAMYETKRNGRGFQFHEDNPKTA